MTQLVWLNGEILPLADAWIGVEDRGFQFADGVYEVIRLYDGRPFALESHLRRLWNSAIDIQVTPPLTPDLLAAEVAKLLARSDAGQAQLYVQLTRGVAPRDHLFPEVVEPTLLFYLQPTKPLSACGGGPGVQLLAVPDDRWRRCWIKSTALLPNVLAKNAAVAECGYANTLFSLDTRLRRKSPDRFGDQAGRLGNVVVAVARHFASHARCVVRYGRDTQVALLALDFIPQHAWVSRPVTSRFGVLMSGHHCAPTVVSCRIRGSGFAMRGLKAKRAENARGCNGG